MLTIIFYIITVSVYSIILYFIVAAKEAEVDRFRKVLGILLDEGYLVRTSNEFVTKAYVGSSFNVGKPTGHKRAYVYEGKLCVSDIIEINGVEYIGRLFDKPDIVVDVLYPGIPVPVHKYSEAKQEAEQRLQTEEPEDWEDNKC